MIPDLTFISAPMVNQSDAPFRLLTRRYGATLTYTQMLDSHRLLNDPDYLHFHLRDLQATHPDWDTCTRPVVAQLCGNDPQVVVSAARHVQSYCDGIGASQPPRTRSVHTVASFPDLNLGCPQEHAREGHYGGYLLTTKDWPLVDSIGGSHPPLDARRVSSVSDAQSPRWHALSPYRRLQRSVSVRPPRRPSWVASSNTRGQRGSPFTRATCLLDGDAKVQPISTRYARSHTRSRSPS